MSSIGPQLPSQPSAKRKHTPEPGDDHAASSSSKHARRNADEINLDDDASSDSDSDAYGPRAPVAAPIVSKPSLGPLLPPPTASARNQDEIDLDDSASSSSSHTGPAPPPHAAAATAQPIPADSDSDSDSDDYGPALPSASNTRRGPIGPTLPPTADPSAPTRDEWMLAPPVNTGYTERDPTKLKARKFASSKPGRGAGPSSDSGLAAAIWTETPEEKLKRLQDAVLGRSDAASGQSAEAAAAVEARTRNEDERNRKVAAAIAAHRGRSLYEEHQADKNGGGGGGGGGSGKNKKTGKGGEEEDDPSKRAFDREKDMALGSKISTAQRRELVAKSANFGGRFQKGSFL
ncbi:hypothetical protein MY11210_002356 [Beauveria gryllotalpidicola]